MKWCSVSQASSKPSSSVHSICSSSRRMMSSWRWPGGAWKKKNVPKRIERASSAHPKIARLDLLVGEELRGAGGMDDLATAQDVGAIRHGEGEREVLLHEEDGQPLALELADHPPHLAHEERSQSFRGLVEEEQVRVAHEGTPDGQHLLLAARQLVRAIGAALAQPGEELLHALEAPAPAAVARHLEILADGKRGKDAATLGHEGHPALHHTIRRPVRDVLALEAHAAVPGRGEADDGADERGLAHAVAAKDPEHLARLHAEGDALQHVAVAVVGVYLLHLEHGTRLSHRDRSPAPADRPAPRRGSRRR